ARGRPAGPACLAGPGCLAGPARTAHAAPLPQVGLVRRTVPASLADCADPAGRPALAHPTDFAQMADRAWWTAPAPLAGSAGFAGPAGSAGPGSACPGAAGQACPSAPTHDAAAAPDEN